MHTNGVLEHINFYSIWESVRAKNPLNDECLDFDTFQDRFNTIAFENENIIRKHLKNKKSTTWISANKVKLGAKLWRPNAIYGNRPNSTKAERVIMGSGLYSFDVDFKDY